MNFKYYRYVNLPIFIGSWLGFAVFGIFLMPLTQPGSLAFYGCLSVTLICFALFFSQGIKIFIQKNRDAERGAELREAEEKTHRKR